MADYSEAIRLNPRDAITYRNRGRAYLERHRYPQAIKDLSQAIRLDSRSPLAYYGRGLAYMRSGEYATAIQNYTDVVRRDPKYAIAYNNRAWIRATCPDATLRNPPEAIADATKACELSAWRVPAPRATLAAAKAAVGDYHGAVHWAKTALQMGFADVQDQDAVRHQLHLYQEGKPYREGDAAKPTRGR